METAIIATTRRGDRGSESPAARRNGSRRRALFVGACTLALGCAAAVANAGSAWEEDWPAPTAAYSKGSGAAGDEAAANAHDFERWTDPDLSLEALDALRRDAQVGDVDAAVALVSRLVDRYERGGATDELFEAVVWIDRYHGNETLARSGLIARVQQHDCKHKVLRLHWVCEAAEAP